MHQLILMWRGLQVPSNKGYQRGGSSLFVDNLISSKAEEAMDNLKALKKACSLTRVILWLWLHQEKNFKLHSPESKKSMLEM